jgi:hypothetical protein
MIYIVWGTHNFGQTDYIPDVDVYVSTQFFHIWYIPLIPLQSYIVLAESGDDFHGVATGWNLKSIAIAWLRAALLVGGVLTIIGGCIAAGERPTAGIPIALAGALAVGAMIGSCYLPYTGYASYEAACELADQVDLTPEYRHRMEVAYGRLPQGAYPQQQALAAQNDPYRPQQPIDDPYRQPIDDPYRPQQQWDDPYRPQQKF